MKLNLHRLWMAALITTLLLSLPGFATPAQAATALNLPGRPQSEGPTPTAEQTTAPTSAPTDPAVVETSTLEPALTPQETLSPAPSETAGEPTLEPTDEPTLEPTAELTLEPTAEPSPTAAELEEPIPAMLESLSAAASFPSRRTINAPYLNSSSIAGDHYTEMGVFWFGKVTGSENYTDVRVGYNDNALVVQANVVDRLFWYDVNARPAKLLKSDAVSLFLQVGNPNTTSLNNQTYRLVAGLNWWEDQAQYRAEYRAANGKWQPADVGFTAKSGYAGANFNNNKVNRGWAMTFTIPFSSLGLSGRPSDGTQWDLAVMVHDRDGGRVNPARYWPETYRAANPSTWGRLRFGMPVYNAPAHTGGGTVTVRHKLNGQVVSDAGVGGDIGNLCNPNNLWQSWGTRNFRNAATVNIQNQGYIGDWPCFARFYVKFPLNKVPKGKVIVSAKLVVHEWGGSDFSQAQPSLIQISTTNNAWSERTINWNNSPRALENVGQAWVNSMDHTIQPDEWPGVRYEWDVTRATAQAYGKGKPLQLALYEADQAFHSGKYFVTSNTADWNAEGRPTLIVEWGNP